MPTVEEAILKARRMSEQARRKNRYNVTKKPATARGLLRVFNNAFRDADYGMPPIATKRVLGMLNTLINMSRRENHEDTWLYELMGDIVENWETIIQQRITTPKGKIFAMSRVPNLNDFLICRDSVIAVIESGKCKVDCPVESSIPENSSISTGEQLRHGPTEEEMQQEMERLYEDYER